MWDWNIRLRLMIAWVSRRYQRWRGKLASMLHRQDTICFLKVCMDHYEFLVQIMLGGTNWKVMSLVWNHLFDAADD